MKTRQYGNGPRHSRFKVLPEGASKRKLKSQRSNFTKIHTSVFDHLQIMGARLMRKIRERRKTQ